MEQEGLSCTLPGSELVQRIEEWRQVAAQARSRTLGRNSVVAVYPLEKELRSKLDRLIEAEKDCCSFMTFDVNEADDQLIVELSVPEQMRHVLPLMLELTGAESNTISGGR